MDQLSIHSLEVYWYRFLNNVWQNILLLPFKQTTISENYSHASNGTYSYW